MGGGAAMRAAAKVAGIGAVNGGLRGVVPDHPVRAAARNAARPVFSISATSSSDGVKPGVAIDASSVQKPCWENEEWEFAGGEEELLFGTGEPMPRFVFGGAPTLQEAKEATSELSVALEKLYLSSPTSTGHASSNVTGKDFGLSVSHSEVLESKGYLNSDGIVVPSAPKHAIQAFRLLNESPAAQTTVASIASDPNVWNAMLQNSALQDFVQSQKMSASFPNMYPNVEEYSHHSDDSVDKKSPKCFDVSSETGESNVEESKFKNGVRDFFQNIKHRVVDMMSSLSDFFETFFGGQFADKVPSNTDGSDSFLGKAWAPSVMMLAVMVIIVVLLKRV